MAHCTISVSFVRHILKRLDIRKLLVEWGFPQLCHTAVLQRQTLSDEKVEDAPPKLLEFLQLFLKIRSCQTLIISYSDGKFRDFLCQDTEQTLQKGLRLMEITPVTLRTYGRPTHNPLYSLLPSW